MTTPASGTHWVTTLGTVGVTATCAFAVDSYRRGESLTAPQITAGQEERFWRYLFGSALGYYCYNNVESTNLLQSFLGVAAGAVAVMSVRSAISYPTISRPSQILEGLDVLKKIVEQLNNLPTEATQNDQKQVGLYSLAAQYCIRHSIPLEALGDRKPFDDLEKSYVIARGKTIEQMRMRIEMLRSIRSDATDVPVFLGMENLEVVPLRRALWCADTYELQRNLRLFDEKYEELTNDIRSKILSTQVIQLMSANERAQENMSQHYQRFQKMMQNILESKLGYEAGPDARLLHWRCVHQDSVFIEFADQVSSDNRCIKRQEKAFLDEVDEFDRHLRDRLFDLQFSSRDLPPMLSSGDHRWNSRIPNYFESISRELEDWVAKIDAHAELIIPIPEE